MSNRKLSSGAVISDKAIALLGEVKADIASAAKSAPGDLEQVKGALKGFAAIDGGKGAVKQTIVGLNYKDGSDTPYRDGWTPPPPPPTPYRDGSGPYKDGWSRYRR